MQDPSEAQTVVHSVPPGRQPHAEPIQPGQIGPTAPDATQLLPMDPIGRPMEPIWRRRGWVVSAAIGALAVGGLVVGILVAANSGSGSPSPAPAAAAGPPPSLVEPSGLPQTPSGHRAGRHAAGAGTLGAGRSGRVRLTGRITAESGTDATLVEPNGLAVDVDLSKIGKAPDIGTSVLIVGTVTNDGRTVQAIRLATAPAGLPSTAPAPTTG
jgi:hypothetical protein